MGINVIVSSPKSFFLCERGGKIDTIEPSYYAILTAGVRYDKRLTANEKLLYAEITALSNKHGYCYARNKYFSDLYNVQVRAVQRWLTNLEECGYITRTVVYKDGTNQVLKRYITLNDMGAGVKNDMGAGVKNDIYNNTSINNTSINSSSKKETDPVVKRNWTY